MSSGWKLKLVGVMAATTGLLGAAPSVAVPTGPQASARLDWPQFHGGPRHVGFNPAEHTVGPDNVSRLSLSWLGNGSTSGVDLVDRSSPAVVGRYVYFGTFLGQLLAFHRDCATAQCDPAWRIQLGEGIHNTPAVVNGTLFVGTASSKGRLYAFDVRECAAASGDCQPLWTGDVDVIDSSPTVVGGIVYVGSYDTGVYAFNANGCGQHVCQPLWVGDTDGYVMNSPAVANGVVYVGDASGYLYAFDSSNCARGARSGSSAPCQSMWRGLAGQPIYDSSPVVKGGFVYTTSFAAGPRSHLEVFAAEGCGKALCHPSWRGGGADYLNSAPAVAYGNVYLGGTDKLNGQKTPFLLVYPANGCGQKICEPLWFGFTAGPQESSDSPPMVANDIVYFGQDEHVRAYPAHGCGQQICGALWEYETQDALVNSSPAMVDGTLYFSGTADGSVPEMYVFKLNG